MDNPFQSPAILSFCPGFLGLERGIERAIGPIRVMAYVEIEAFIIANLVAGMEARVLGAAPIWTDARTFNAQPFRGRIHGIIGGYPCPGESLAGLREGHLYKGFIWPAIRKAIAAANPVWCFFENVDDHLTGTYPIVQRSLRNMGYAVEAGIYSAEEVGAPHERNRLFILAVADTHRLSTIRGLKHLLRTSETNEGTPQRKNRKWRGYEFANLREKVDYATSSRFKPGPELQNRKALPELERRRSFSWPMPQGFRQHEWEEPRTVEPGLGSTINGYNFREDLLRAYGNSVVEQTAEVAFRDLLNKHLQNYGSRSV